MSTPSRRGSSTSTYATCAGRSSRILPSRFTSWRCQGSATGLQTHVRARSRRPRPPFLDQLVVKPDQAVDVARERVALDRALASQGAENPAEAGHLDQLAPGSPQLGVQGVG